MPQRLRTADFFQLGGVYGLLPERLPQRTDSPTRPPLRLPRKRSALAQDIAKGNNSIAGLAQEYKRRPTLPSPSRQSMTQASLPHRCTHQARRPKEIPHCLPSPLERTRMSAQAALIASSRQHGESRPRGRAQPQYAEAASQRQSDPSDKGRVKSEAYSRQTKVITHSVAPFPLPVPPVAPARARSPTPDSPDSDSPRPLAYPSKVRTRRGDRRICRIRT